MFIRRNPQADGTTAISIAHSVRRRNKDGKSVSGPVIIAHLGDEDTIEPEAVDELIGLLAKLRDARRAKLAGQDVVETPAQEVQALQKVVRPIVAQLKVMCSRSIGLRLVVEAWWRAGGLGRAVRDALPPRTRNKEAVAEQIFGMVWNRLENPQSKLSCVEWLRDSVWFPQAAEWDEDDLYRTLDKLRRVWSAVEAHLLTWTQKRRSPQDLAHVLIDTSSIFTEADMDDTARAEVNEAWQTFLRHGGDKPADPMPQVVNNPAFRLRGHSKDGHPHDPQVIIGLALSMKGDVLTHELFPGNTSDKVTTRVLCAKAHTLLPEANPLAVMDAGMAGLPNLRWLHGEGFGWVAGMAVRQSAPVAWALDNDPSWETIERTTHRNRTPEVATWSVSLMPLPPDLRAVADREESILLARNPARERRDLRMLDRQLEEVTAALAKDDARVGQEVKHPLLRDKRLKAWVKVSADGLRLEVDEGAVASGRTRGLRQLEKELAFVEAALEQSDDAERDGLPHKLFRHRTLRRFVRKSADGQHVELRDDVVEAARQAAAPETVDREVAAVRTALAANDAPKMTLSLHPLLSNNKLRRYVKTSMDGSRVVLDDEAVAAERARAGLRAVRTTATDRTADEVLRAYDALLEVESTFRDFKDVLDIRPMYHRAEPRIRSHAMICVLAEHCLNWAEEMTGRSWAEIKKTFSGVQASQMSQGPSMTWWQRTELTEEATALLTALGYRAGPSRWASDGAIPIFALPGGDAE